MTLSGPRREAASGKGNALIVLVHGYGADGNDLIGLADPLAPHLPDAIFVAPNAPQKCTGNPMGYQWFPIPWLDGSTEQAAADGMRQAVVALNAYLDDLEKSEGIAPDRTILVGFSQGTMMSLHVAPRRERSFAGVVGFSGRLLDPELLDKETVSKPPIVLIHGDQDDVVPTSSMPLAASQLGNAGFDVTTHLSQGTGHGIAPDGLQVAYQFIAKHLG